MRRFLALLSFVILFVVVSSAVACPVSDKEFLHQITSSGDWTEVHAVFKRNFPACPDNELYADGYTNMVVGVLADNWADIATLNELAAKDDGFRQFVLRHIGVSAGDENLHRVLRSAQANCPQPSARLCMEIAARCKRAFGVKK